MRHSPNLLLGIDDFVELVAVAEAHLILEGMTTFGKWKLLCW